MEYTVLDSFVQIVAKHERISSITLLVRSSEVNVIVNCELGKLRPRPPRHLAWRSPPHQPTSSPALLYSVTTLEQLAYWQVNNSTTINIVLWYKAWFQINLHSYLNYMNYEQNDLTVP